MISISRMNLSDVELALEWAAAEGWNPGLDDASAFLAADPEGFLIARAGETPVASISVIKQGAGDGFLGLYICAPEFRGRGHGWAVWQAGCDYLAGRSIGLDGVVAQQDNYRKSGFELLHRNIRFQGSTQTIRASDGSTPQAVENIDVINAGNLNEILAMDRAIFGVQRDAFMRNWLINGDSRHALVYRENDELLGFGAIRECREHFKLGPVVAASDAIARCLMQALISKAEASEIIIDIPEPQGSAMELARSIGLHEVFETARMYNGVPPAMDMQRIFGVTTLELG